MLYLVYDTMAMYSSVLDTAVLPIANRLCSQCDPG